MSAKPPYRLIVFDWDGTLMDSIATIVACATEAAHDVGHGDEGTAARSRQAIGLALDETSRRILPKASEEVRAAWVERYRHHWFATYREKPICFDGVGPLLESLSAAGYWLAVATGKSRKGLDRDLEVTGHGRFFLATRTVNEAASKPNPQMLLDILDELGIGRGEALMVGDTTFDLEMAKNAGVAAVAVLTGSHDRDTLLACGPVACLAAATELPAWLEGRTG